MLARIEHLTIGDAGNAAPVGEGVSEMRIHYGPGYRVYFVQRDKVLVILLYRGNKGIQSQDIDAAKVLARETKD
ncbi:type II toxin-antitoxin system RelE/ParE family toxin [Xanthobacter sp. NFH-44]|uniref:type II toxin-antitoxin system RelE/ParE family toxin n=1 Tax=unclassified Xanthobacter TaxID=2623496 RepID=UPI00351CDA8D